ncbi:hypothetical protein lerEdw1_005769 [Lerista edwardsae]|nr:hypothetical protein lerEdw1_005769 [Lerista edwardsae]
MDLCSYLGEDDSVFGGSPGWEDSDISLSSRNDMEGDLQDESTDSAADESGPLLRCLKRIYRKGKKEKTRRRRTITSENEHPGSAQEPELLLASWRSTMDYFNSKREDELMKKSFLKFLSILSKTINWGNMTDFFMDNFTSDVVGAITEMVKKEPPEPNAICLHALSTVIDLRQGRPDVHRKLWVTRFLPRCALSLPSLLSCQNLFIGTYQTFSEMLQQLMMENPVPSELERILQLMVSWLQSSEDDQRERAIWSSASLLNFVATKLKLDTLSKFTRLGHLVAVLGICCGDPVKSISSKAAKSVHLLLAVVLGQKIARLDEKNVHTEAIKRKHKEFLESWNPLVFLKNPSRVAEVFGLYFSPREKTDFILTALDGLTEHCGSTSCATTEGLLASIARNCSGEMEKVSDIVDGICSRLNLIHRPSTRKLVMKLVGLLASRTEHVDTVISRLGCRNSSELWQSLSTEEMVEDQLMENLLTRLQTLHSSEQQTSAMSVAVTQALYEVVSVPESKEAIQRLYPELLTALLNELCFATEADASPDTAFLQKQCGREEGLTSFAVEAIQLLLLRIGCHYEVTFMERTRGWAMLQSSRELLQGVTLLASPCDGRLPLLLPQFLHCQEIEQLPDEQIFECLEDWLHDPNPDVRSLGLRGLGVLAIHPDKVEEVKALLPSILGSLEEADGRVISEGITAIQNLLKFMQRNDIVGLAEKLLPLFSNTDPKARTCAIALFAELPSVVKKKEKYLIQEQVTQSLLPLLLHLQDEEPEVVKSWKVKSIPAILLQCLDHLQCSQVSIRRAAAIFIGCVAQCAEPAVITQEKKDLIFLSLSKLHRDPNPSVRLTALQATRMVQESCGISSNALRDQISLQQFGRQEGPETEKGHWDVPDPAVTHRWNPASPVSHRIVFSNTKRRLSGPHRQV